MGTTVSSEAFRRAALPEVLFIPDLAVAMQQSLDAARRNLLRGKYGPFGRLGRRLYVMRDSLIESLASAARTAQLERTSSAGGLSLVRGGDDQHAP